MADVAGPANATMAGSAAAAGVIAVLVLVAACIAYHRRKAARGATLMTAGLARGSSSNSSSTSSASPSSDDIVWHDRALIRKPAVPHSTLAPAPPSGSSAINPLLLVEFANKRRVLHSGARGAMQRSSFAPQAHLDASNR